MSGPVPPPLPIGGPPPLPTGGPPPAHLPMPPPPPPPMPTGLPPPPNSTHIINIPIPPSHHPMVPVGRGAPPPRGGGMRPGMRSPFTNTVLITNVPYFFHGYNHIRDLLYPCGTAKTCSFYPRVPKRNKENKGEDTTDNNEEGEGNVETMKTMATTNGGDNTMMATTNDGRNKNKITVLVNMVSPDQAVKVFACFKNFTGQLDDQYKDMRCYMLPSSHDVPLPPPLVDNMTQKVLGSKLFANFNSLEKTTQFNATSRNKDDSNDKPGATAATTGNETEGDDVENTTNKDENNDQPKLLDADKVAAAAGGVSAYDAEEDPLNAPAVLAAVKEFRRKLDRTHGNQKTQRAEMVAKKLKEVRPRIRTVMESEKKRRLELLKQRQEKLKLWKDGGIGRAPPAPVSLPVPAQTSLPQPPLPGGGPPPPPPSLGLPPPPMQGAERGASADSGKRGRSNLPAWMTQQQQQQPEEPASKKAKTATDSSSTTYPSHFPQTLPTTSHAILRQFLANQVRESMGEEEATLIDFLYSHILEGKATSELLQELQVVLEEEADSFLKAVWVKVQEMQQQ